MLRLFYAAGVRGDELVRLTWGDLQPRDDAGQLTVFGKGGKTRIVLLPHSVWQDLADLPSDCPDGWRCNQPSGWVAIELAFRTTPGCLRHCDCQ
jgi:integrase